MTMTRRTFLALASAPILLQDPAPAPIPKPLGPGQYPLKLGSDRDGLIYIPRGYKPDTPAPMIVMLHGAGSTGSTSTLQMSLADEHGIVMLAPDSRDERTWDLVLGGYGPDVEFIRAAIQWTFARCKIDRQRIGLAGVSDGASYSLSLGISNGDFFTRVIAFSPGEMTPADVNGKPHIFISHGTKDPVMPIDITARKFVGRLKTLGYDVTYREFDGGHRTPPEVTREAFAWFMR